MNDAKEQVVLVDAADRPIGTMGKWPAHTEGRLHRAFSVFLFDPTGELLMQQRASVKYHSPGLWSNTCCGHPRPGEATADAAARRLWEEMGLRADLQHAFTFTYRAELEKGLIEHEVDHVFIGTCDTAAKPNPFEVQATRLFSRERLQAALQHEPAAYSAWLPLCVWRAWDAYLERSMARCA